MKNKCDKCGEPAPKNLQKGNGVQAPKHHTPNGRVVAPRASGKSSRGGNK